MPLRIPAPKTLSNLIIDVDKGWAGKNITNLGDGAFDLNAKLNAVINAADIQFKTGALHTGSEHAEGGALELSVAGLSGLLADDQHVLDAEVLAVAAALVHAARHKDGGADELDVSELAGAIGADGEIPETDGDAVSWVDPDGRYDPKAHRTTHEPGGADEVRGINVPSVPEADDTGHGIESIKTVGENVDPGEVLYKKDDGKYWLADASAAASMPAVVMAMETILADAAGRVLHIGPFRHDAWDWTVGNGEANLLFVHTTAGAIVQLANKPAGSGDQVQVLGYVETADSIFFNPSYELVEIA